MAACSITLDAISGGENWAALPQELLDLILRKLVLLPDYIRFGAVCKSWLSVALDQRQERIRTYGQEPPMLLIPEEDGSQLRNMYSVSENKIYRCGFSVPCKRRCSGSSYGWLALANEDWSITLLNPFACRNIHLPPIMKLPSYYNDDIDFSVVTEFLIHKVILSCDPCLHPDDYVVAAIHHEFNKVAFIRSGEESWTYPKNPFFPTTDILFHKGQLYAVNCQNQLIAIEYDQLSTKIEESSHVENILRDAPVEYLVRTPRDYSEYSWVSYIVQSLEGDILLVRRLHFDDGKVTVGFQVHKLVMKQHSSDRQEKAEWVEIQSLGSSALFVGIYHSICIPATSFTNCHPNSIYYTDDCCVRNFCSAHEAIDMGIFDLGTKGITKYYAIPDSLRYMPPAVWILPKLE